MLGRLGVSAIGTNANHAHVEIRHRLGSKGWTFVFSTSRAEVVIFLRNGNHMEQPAPSSSVRAQPGLETFGRNEAHSSGVSWAAIIAGAFVAAALSLALLALGVGIGFSAVSPWATATSSGARIGRTAIAWLILMQLISSSVGGYLAGRLCTRWVNIHTHEVYFRDTAHGFLVWAVGLVISAAFLTSAATSMAGGAARAGTTVTDRIESAQSKDGPGSNAYVVDKLLRTSVPGPDNDNGSGRGELGLIFANALREGSLPPADKLYLAHVVAARTGVSERDAQERVDDAFAQEQQAAEGARRAVAHSMVLDIPCSLDRCVQREPGRDDRRQGARPRRGYLTNAISSEEMTDAFHLITVAGRAHSIHYLDWALQSLLNQMQAVQRSVACARAL